MYRTYTDVLWSVNSVVYKSLRYHEHANVWNIPDSTVFVVNNITRIANFNNNSSKQELQDYLPYINKIWLILIRIILAPHV